MTRSTEIMLDNMRIAERLASDCARAIIDPPHASKQYRDVSASVAEARQIIESIETLREDEGSEIAIQCDNPEGDPNCSVVVTDDWTGWISRRFDGETLADALQAACKAKEGAAK
jgi:hypothetical protein